MNKYLKISLYLKTFSSLTVQEEQEQQQQLSNIKDCLRKLAVKNYCDTVAMTMKNNL